MKLNNYYNKYQKYLKRYKTRKGGSQTSSESNQEVKLQMDLSIYIRKWISIENILCKDYYKRFYISSSEFDSDEKDTCSNIKNKDECTDPCLWYHLYKDGIYQQKCINKERDKCTIIPDIETCVNNSKCDTFKEKEICNNNSSDIFLHNYDKYGKLNKFKVIKHQCKWDIANEYCNTNNRDMVRHIVKNEYNTENGPILVDNPCVKHHSFSTGKDICVSKSRRSAFEGTELAKPLTGSLGNKFKILASLPFTTKDKRYTKLIYTQILVTDTAISGPRRPENTDMYIGFPCGIIMDMNLLWDNQDFTDYLELIFYNYIGEFSHEANKVILFGHSMGCVLALRFAYYIFKTHPIFFRDRCIVVGSGPHCWIPKPSLNLDFDETFTDLVNIEIFVTGSEYSDSDDEDSDDSEDDMKMFLLLETNKAIEDGRVDDQGQVDISKVKQSARRQVIRKRQERMERKIQAPKKYDYYVDEIIINRIDMKSMKEQIKNIKKFTRYYPMTLLNTTDTTISDIKITKRVKTSKIPNIHDWEMYYHCLSS